MRNALHFDWNADGEIFSFDSDMEPEFGVPWYRPVRVFWMPSGADLGYRGNSGKYPTWYEDSLPPLVEIGLGSPVGVTFGYRTAFPAKYQKALYVADNNYGRIIAVHLKPVGSGYVATSWENFIWPKSLYGGTPRMPHNVTDMIVARDGTFYYLIGNRRTQSYLMKATYVGSQPTARVEYRNTDGAQDRARPPLARAVPLDAERSEGRRRRLAASRQRGSLPALRRARRARDRRRPTRGRRGRWPSRTPRPSIIALLALARVGGPAANEELFAALDRFPLSTLSDPLRIQKLRVIEVAVSRNGKPSDAADSEGHRRRRRGVSRRLVRAEHRDVADPRRVQRRDRGREDAAADGAVEDLRGAVRLSLQPPLGDGWAGRSRRRKTYFKWFNEDHADDQHRYDYREWFNRVNQQPRIAGNGPYLNQLRTAAVATLTDAEKADAELSAILNAYRPPPPVAAAAVRRPLSRRRRPAAAAAASSSG